MSFTIPSKDVAQDASIQSVWYDVDIAILVASLEGRGVVSGCGVTAQGSPDMTVAVAAGVVRNANGSQAAVTGGNLTITAANGSNPRVDLISASSAGVKTYTAGVAAASPKPPDLPAGHIGLAFVLVGTSDTAIQTAEITDKRVIVPVRELDYVEFTAPVSITATTEAGADTVVTATALAFDGATPIDVEFFCPYGLPNASNGAQINFYLFDGASSIGRLAFTQSPTATAANPPHLTRRLTPSNASHTYSIRAAVNTGTGSVGAGAGGNGNVMPGFIRIRPAR